MDGQSLSAIESMVSLASRQLLQSFVEATRLTFRIAWGYHEDRAYVYASRSTLYISLTLREFPSITRDSCRYIALLVLGSVVSGIRGRKRFIATTIATIALFLLSSFLPLPPLATIVIIVVAVAMLGVSLYMLRRLRRYEMETSLEKVHARLMDVDSGYRDAFTRIETYLAKLLRVCSSVVRGRDAVGSIHFEGIGIFRYSSKHGRDYVVLDLVRVVGAGPLARSY